MPPADKPKLRSSSTIRSSGFTLIELAVVLLIVGLLLGSLIVPFSAQSDLQYRKDNEKALSEIRETLLGFVIVNGRLPCPAQRDIATATTNAGAEAVTSAGGPCACSTGGSGIATIGTTACNDDASATVAGVLPWATLGLPESDAWGNRFTYRITTRFGRLASGQTEFGGSCVPTSNPTASAFALCSQGSITVKAAAGGTNVASTLPVIVVSHGKTSYGAWTTAGSQLSGSSGDELENENDNATYVSNTTIDDQLTWLSSGLLMNRMISAGKLP